jgi:arginyl-tRNA synthetase
MQLVKLLRDGVPVRMSKRTGKAIALADLLDEISVDAARWYFNAKPDTQMEFDLGLAVREDSENPIYYVEYAHARICSILRRAIGVSEQEAHELGMDEVARRALGDDYDLSLLVDPTELALSRKLSEFPDLVASCARDRAPFRITHFVEEVAGAFHAFYTQCQVLPSEGRPVDEAVSRARLAACDAVRMVLALSLKLIGVSAPTRM